MSVTILRPTAVIVRLDGRGYGKDLDATTVAAKQLGLVVRGSRYYDAAGNLVFVNRTEACAVLRGYRWLVEHAGRWFLAVPAGATAV